MNAEQVLIRGILKPDGTLVLEGRPRLPAGPVEVVIRVLPEAGSGSETWWDFLQRNRAELIAQGHSFRTKEEIDAASARLHELDEQRRREITRLQSPRE